jgi:hypothetical protein
VAEPIVAEVINEAVKQANEPVKQMQVGNAKGLLSMISNQLKKHEIKKQKQ